MYDVLKYVHNNINKSLFAGDVAKEFGYSKWYFCERFKNFTGKTFVEYVRHYRIQLAGLDLLSGAKVIDVATSYGYDSASGFNKAFLKEYGCSPTEYLKQVKESHLYYEKRRISMVLLSDRCASLREEAVNKKSFMKQYFAQRNVYFTIGQAQAIKEGESISEAIAAGISYTLDRFTPVIIPGELIVGFNFGEGKYPSQYFPDDDAAGWEIIKNNGICESDARSFFDFQKNPPVCKDTPPVVELSEVELQTEKEWSAMGRCIDSNHTVLGYEAVLKKGFAGILKDVEAAECNNGNCPLYESAKRICNSAINMGEKYVQKAKELLESGDEDYQKADLEQVIKTCSRVPKYPASNFAEAVQGIWFAHIINTWEDYINANSIGRLDQILYPYYTADIEKGILTKEQAFELICCLWIKHNIISQLQHFAKQFLRCMTAGFHRPVRLHSTALAATT